jgi:hypothetical protein
MLRRDAVRPLSKGPEKPPSEEVALSVPSLTPLGDGQQPLDELLSGPIRESVLPRYHC